jgi:DNA polymerase-3 subunit gamma/tau
MTDKKSDSYLVLARKYRSRTFAEMVGQDALVQTLSNAIQAQRIHHAYVLTGIRGTGKTTTARLLAMALNCENGPSITWAEDDINCKAIIEGNHVDVLEFDAASHTGVDDIKDLFEGVAYAPAQGRYKVYIIDEVHMLSKQAFNALLKTLEEPPENVKFIFATTEANKIPVTVLSRCQRFDLKRIQSDVLFEHYSNILKLEKIEAEDSALKMIAKAADGSARDGLSLLDQAIVKAAGGKIKTDDVSKMLGLADGALVYDLFEETLHGNTSEALDKFNHMYIHGFDPLLVVNQLLQLTHLITRLKVVPDLKTSADLTELEKTRGVEFADKLKLENLSRVYQMLLTASREAKQADRPQEALEMALVRVSHLAALPSVESLIQQVQSGTTPEIKQQVSTQPATEKPVEQAAEKVEQVTQQTEQKLQSEQNTTSSLSTWEEVVKAVKQEKPSLGAMLSQKGRLVSFNMCEISLSIDSGLMDENAIATDLRKVLNILTQQNWNIIVNKSGGGETLSEINAQKGEVRKEKASGEDDVKKILEAFPGSELVEVTDVSEKPPWED